MLAVPKIAIVGRPNVGKSSLFNWLMRERIAIVDNQAGVTRDRLTGIVDEDDCRFELVDTGGIGIEDVDRLTSEIEAQIRIGIEEASMILCVVDAKTGLAPLDLEVAARIRKLAKPTLCVVNKTDGPGLDLVVDEFHRLGLGTPLAVSVLANRNRADLLAWIAANLPPADPDASPVSTEMRIAIVGRRNVGKSTFVNALARAPRMIVSEVPGTTRDSVDVRFELDGKSFIAVDTPGLRKTKSVRTDIDFYGATRAKMSIRRADVVLLFLDAMETISRVDKQLSGYIEEHHKPSLFVVNKWDLAKDKAHTSDWVEYLREAFPSMSHVPIAFTTGKSGKNLKTVINHAQMLFKQAQERVTTGQLNQVIRFAVDKAAPPIHQNRRPKIFYASQIGVRPPTIALVCSDPEAFAPHYRRYLLGVLRDHLPFSEVPIRLTFQPRKRAEGDRNVRDKNGMLDPSQSDDAERMDEDWEE